MYNLFTSYDTDGSNVELPSYQSMSDSSIHIDSENIDAVVCGGVGSCNNVIFEVSQHLLSINYNDIIFKSITQYIIHAYCIYL